jgi:hypothetical protein
MSDTGGYGPQDDADNPVPAPGVVLATSDTPDPFGTADADSYQDGTGSGVDVPVDYLPPWALTRAPGTVRTVTAGTIVPINPWKPVIALLDADQLAMLNRESASRQVVGFWADDQRDY